MLPSSRLSSDLNFFGDKHKSAFALTINTNIFAPTGNMSYGGRHWLGDGKRHRSGDPHRDNFESSRGSFDPPRDYHNSSRNYSCHDYSNLSRSNSYRNGSNGSESSRYKTSLRLSIEEGEIPEDHGVSFNAQEEHEIADLKKKVIDLNKQVVDLTAKVVHLESKEEG